MRRLLITALALGTSLVAAVFKDEVGDIDFHYPLLGLPQAETTFFHRPRKDDRASLLYTLSDVGVLGAVNPSTGAIVWRQQIADDVTHGGGHLRAPEGENWVAAAQGNRVQAWNALTGRNVWHAQFAGEVRDLEILELTESSRKDVLVLFEEDGATVLRRLHGALGSVVWEFRETTRDRALQVSTNLAHVFVVSLHGTGIKITSLEPATGGRIDHAVVDGRGDVRGPDDVRFVGGNSAAPFLAWTSGDMARLHVQVMGAKGKQELALPADAVSVDVHAPHLTSSQPHFLLHTRTKGGNKAEVYHTDLKTGRIAKAYELPLLPGLGAVSTSSDGANVYFTRIADDEVLVFSSESDALLARWALDSTGSVALRAVSEVIQRAGGKELAVRSAVVTSSDDWVLIRNGGVDWTRPEGLSGAVAATWAEVPEVEDLAKALAEEAHTNPWNAYLHRVGRHMGDLKYLPAYLASLPTTIIDSITGAVKGKPRGLSRDSFGFSKIMILATRRGRVYALDAGNHGEILWSKTVFPQAPGSTLEVRGLLAGEDVVTLRGSKGERAVIRVSDGEIVEMETGGAHVSSAAVIDAAAGKWLLALDGSGSPIDKSVDRELDFTVVVREGDVVRGVKLSAEDGKAVGTEMWRMPLLPGQRIVDIVTPPGHDPIASIGRVLGDRTVMYKYLNPNAVLVVVAESPSSSSSSSSTILSVRIVDGVSGQMLVSQRYDGVDTGTVSCTMSENWFACSFFGQHTVDDGSGRLIKGHQLVVSDMYESASANDRGGDGSDAMSPLERPGAVPLPHVVSQAWVVSEPLTALAVTQTRQGIANRQVLAYLPESHAIMGLARFVVDPRRPVGRDPTAAEMEAEGLARYVPAMEVDARSFLTHERDVLGVGGIVASPTAVESTSLVLAFGVDVFGTRVAPSGTFDILDKGFNKVTLLGTVVALGWGVVFLAPMVRKKQINRRWEAFL